MSLADDMNLRRLYAVRYFLTYCILSNEYHFPPDLESAVKLTAAGDAICEQLIRDKPSLSGADAKVAVLAEFVRSDDFLVDYHATRYDDLQTALSNDIATVKIRFPWVFGDSLESAYIEEFGREPKDFLIHDETLRVLDRLPQGVFQVADITVGPYGMIKVVQERCVPPSLCGPEILCLDPGCDGVHHVVFET